MASELSGAPGFLVTSNVAVPVGTGTGSALNNPTVVPIIPGMVFNAAGKGVLSLDNQLSGQRGSIDLLLDLSATGTARTVCYLTDNPATPTQYIAVRIDASNRPRINFTNSTGVVVASVTPSYTALAANQKSVTVRFCWNSSAIVTGTRFASLKVNRDFVPDANWATNPTASWTSFTPTHLVLGTSLGDADFNGTILAVQLSETVTP